MEPEQETKKKKKKEREKNQPPVMMDGNGLRNLDVSVLKSSGRRSAATNVDCCEMSRFFLFRDVVFLSLFFLFM